MPNHITTQVEITGTKKQIDTLIKKTKIKTEHDLETNEFDFNGIVPTPSDIFQGNLGQEERAKYGNRNWYDWNSTNWGTKWNAYEVIFTEHTDTKLVLQFDTAWDTPRLIWDALEAQGYGVKGICYGEMEGFEYIGTDAESVWEAYTNVEVEYVG